MFMCTHLQIRALNSYMLLGNWSEPVFVNGSTVLSPGDPGASHGVTVYVVVAVTAVVASALVVVFILICIYQHFYFNQRMKQVRRFAVSAQPTA